MTPSESSLYEMRTENRVRVSSADISLPRPSMNRPPPAPADAPDATPASAFRGMGKVDY